MTCSMYSTKCGRIVSDILLLFLLAHNALCEVMREPSSNQVAEKAKQEDESAELYYLPRQTVFGDSGALGGGLSTTSPPRLDINPAPIHTEYTESTLSLTDAVSFCSSETPVVELESRFLMPSSIPIRKSAAMSGHLEVASKTDSLEEASKPAAVVQGTILQGGVTDL